MTDPRRIAERIRAHAYWTCGLREPVDHDALRASQWNPWFERLMRDRLVMGAMRYGDLYDGVWYDTLACVRRYLDLYEATGNLEALVDAANVALVEFSRPQHSRWHYAPEDRKEQGHTSCL